jgi:hypothetical protein
MAIIPEAIAEQMDMAAEALMLEAKSGSKWCSARGRAIPSVSVTET